LLSDFKTKHGKDRQYWGSTELLGAQDATGACEVRLAHHLMLPLKAMSTAVRSSLKIDPVGNILTKSNCLSQDAILATKALPQDSTARGACFSCFKLGAFLVNNARRVRGAVGELEGQAARHAVVQHAAGLDASHPLRKHLEGKHYKDAPGAKVVLPRRAVRSRSGTSGHLVRQRQLAAKKYTPGSLKDRRLKRGVHFVAVVKAENARRKVRKKATKK